MEAPFPRSWRQRLVLVPAVRALARYFRARVHGLERVPADRPVIYVGKHPRGYLYLETMLLGLFTFWDAGRPPIRVLEKTGTSLHKLPLLAWIRRHVGSIPASEDAALAALSNGESILVFPGGTRELYGPADTLRWGGRTGFARLAALSGAPVVPFAIVGADQQHPLRVRLGARRSLWLPLWPLPVPMDFHFGAPLEPPADAGPAAVSRFAAEVAESAKTLLEDGLARRRAPWSLR